MRRWAWLAMVVALSSVASARSKPPPKKDRVGAPREMAARAAGVGRVRFVTAKRAYLDRGALDGLKVGDAITLVRLGRSAGTCKLDAVAEREAICAAGNLRPGDSFRLKKAAPPAVAEAPTLPPLPPAEKLDRAAAEIAALPVATVEFAGESSFGRERGVDASLGHAFWTNAANLTNGFQQERVDLSLRGIPIGLAGYRAYVEMSAIRWDVRPSNVRFRPGNDTQFYLWEAELTQRDELGPHYVLSAGRIWPWHTPGLAMLDGVQLGWRSTGGGIEAGAYGGLYPDQQDLAPASDQWAAGAYSSLAHAGSKDDLVRLVRDDTRVGVRNSLTAGSVLEAETQALLGLGAALDFAAGGRFAMASKGDTSPSLESAFGQVGIRPRPNLRGFVSFRYLGRAVAEDAPLAGEALALQGSYLGTLDVSWDIRRSVGVAVMANADQDAATSRSDVRGSGELRLPKLFRDRGGIALGYEQYTGWIEGNGVYVQAMLHPWEPVLLMSRVSYSMDRYDLREQNAQTRELGAYANIDGRIASWLNVRAALLWRTPISIQGFAPDDQASGLVASLFLAGLL